MTELKSSLRGDLNESSKEKEMELSQRDLVKWERNLKKAYLVHFLMGFHMISGILMPFFLEWGGLIFVEVMLVQSYCTVMVLIFEIPCGAIADYLSRKLSLILGAAIIGLAAFIYSIYPKILIFLLGETLWAFGAALLSGTDQAFIYDTLKKLGKQHEISKFMARILGFTLVGIGISAPIGSLIGSTISLPLVMRLMTIPMIGAALVGLTFKEPRKDYYKNQKENYFRIIKSGTKELINSKNLRILAFDLILAESMTFFIIWTYQLYLEVLEFQLAFFGFISTAVTVVQIIFNNIAPKLENHFTNKRAFIRVYTIIPGIGFLLMSFIRFTPICIALILLVIGTGFSRSIIFTKGINKSIQSDNRATILSTINMIANLFRTILYPFIGYLTMVNIGFTFIFLGTAMILLAVFSRIRNHQF